MFSKALKNENVDTSSGLFFTSIVSSIFLLLLSLSLSVLSLLLLLFSSFSSVLVSYLAIPLFILFKKDGLLLISLFILFWLL